LYYVRTDEVISHNYARYLAPLNAYFADCTFAAVVNWHEGMNAPDAIFTVHTTGDVVSGIYGAAHPIYTRNMLRALDWQRQSAGLTTFTTMTEGTHWSGVPYGSSPEMITAYPVPLVDIEIGSNEASWSNSTAIEVVARALLDVFDATEDGRLRSLLCLGGVHLETAFSNPVLASSSDYPLAISHILPNQWIVAGEYETLEGLKKLEACLQSIVGGVHAIVYHDNLKGPYKAQARLLARELQIPCFKHQLLRNVQQLPLWS
jgi:D-tyrosyl-tRNA(Tyr) deacylase